MSFNIVDLVKDQITDGVLEKAGGLLGGDASKLSSGVESTVPALLGGLTSAASAPGKSSDLFNAVNNADDGLLNDFAGALGGGNSSNMIDQGSGVLTSLMGSGMMGNLGSVLSSVTGMSRGGSGSLMGMLAPVILGVLKKQVMGGGLDAGGLLSMLQGQKSNVANAMPANLTSQLGKIQGFDGLPNVSGIASSVSGAASGAVDSATGAVGSATGAVGSAASSAASNVGSAASNVGHSASNVGQSAKSSGGGLFKVLIPAAIALGLGWLAFTFLGKKDVDAPDVDVSGAASDAAGAATDAAGDAADAATDAAAGAADAAGDAADAATDAAGDAADAATDAAGDAADAATDAAAGAADAVGDAAAGAADVSELSGNVTGMFNQVSESLGGVTDVESATAALPGLEEIGGQVAELPDLFDKVPEAARGPLQGIVGEGMGSLQPIMEKVQAIPGVGDIIGPVMGPIMETLGGLGG